MLFVDVLMPQVYKQLYCNIIHLHIITTLHKFFFKNQVNTLPFMYLQLCLWIRQKKQQHLFYWFIQEYNLGI